MDKWDELKARMNALNIQESDLIEKFILGSGKGGQKVNKTSSCVYLKHVPTGFEVKCQKTRFRDLNRLYARRELCEKMERALFQEKSKKAQEIEKIRRQKRKRSKRSKEKMLKDKKAQSLKKELRRSPSE